VLASTIGTYQKLGCWTYPSESIGGRELAMNAAYRWVFVLVVTATALYVSSPAALFGADMARAIPPPALDNPKTPS